MKEQIIKILKEWLQDKGAIIFYHDIAVIEVTDELYDLIDAEVEKRIAERMPTKEEMESEIDQNPMDMVYAGSFAECYEWFRSRMKGGENEDHPTNKEKFDGNYLPDTDDNR